MRQIRILFTYQQKMVTHVIRTAANLSGNLEMLEYLLEKDKKASEVSSILLVRASRCF